MLQKQDRAISMLSSQMMLIQIGSKQRFFNFIDLHEANDLQGVSISQKVVLAPKTFVTKSVALVTSRIVSREGFGRGREEKGAPGEG